MRIQGQPAFKNIRADETECRWSMMIKAVKSCELPIGAPGSKMTVQYIRDTVCSVYLRVHTGVQYDDGHDSRVPSCSRSRPRR